MTDDRKSGIGLIAGSVGGMFTMAIHPTAGLAATADQYTHLAVTSGAVHSLALLSNVLILLGACGLVCRIAARDRVAFAGLVTFALATVAIMIAAAVSGFIVPSIMRQMVRDVPAAAQQWKIVIAGIFQINQAFARIFSVAASLAIILWSLSALRNGGFGRFAAIYGCIMSSAVILVIAVGHLRLDVHGMALVGLGQAIWFIVVGAQLCSRPVSS